MNKEKVTEEQVLNGEDDVLISYLVQNNSFEYNMDKAIEEAIEFVEVLVKLKTKHKDNPKRPNKIEAIKEFGDLCLRGVVALETLFVEETKHDKTFVCDKITSHTEDKLKKLRSYLKKGTFKGGL